MRDAPNPASWVPALGFASAGMTSVGLLSRVDEVGGSFGASLFKNSAPRPTIPSPPPSLPFAVARGSLL